LHSFINDVLVRGKELRKPPVICLGHGRDTAWKSVFGHLKGSVTPNVDVVNFETDELPGREATEILKKMMERATFAVVLMTAEDQTADGKWRARQNVVHEVGLFQGRLGFEKVVMLVDEKVERPTNLFGVLHIPFTKIEDSFERLDRALAVAGLIAQERTV
jgi:predicted nucleotide-binding protein